MLDAEWDDHATGENLRQLREFSLAWQWIGHRNVIALIVFCAVGFTFLIPLLLLGALVLFAGTGAAPFIHTLF